ncbi:EspA/EspE family type VII secretion system effector [Mycobacterium basiliense]|uniref:EspA/EspE family type VII secretion system effector n=1 Tax=Mycobacterium basiliense TaxID=2094119 RepID=UPI001301032F|nr:EspA/EspE family type VII secretion system effector [Mycobacterium basiliense]
MNRAFIIDPTVAAINGLELLLGIGIPNDGSILSFTSSLFDKGLNELESAFPGDSWQGSAADKYSSKNETFANFFKELEELERELEALIADQASAVKKTREILDDAKKGLEYVRPAAVDMTYIPIVGWGMSATFQATACAVAMTAVGVGLAYLIAKTLINAVRLLVLLAKLAKLLASVVASVVSAVVDVVAEIWDFLKNAFEYLEQLWDKLTGWVSKLLSQWFSKLESFFEGVPGLGGLSGLSQLTSLFGSSGSSASGGSASLASAAGLSDAAGSAGSTGLGSMLGGSGFGGLSKPAQLRSAASQANPSVSSAAPVGNLMEQMGEPSQPASAQGPQGMGGMHPASGSKDATTKKYAEGAAAGTDDAERAPVEAGVSGAQATPLLRAV